VILRVQQTRQDRSQNRLSSNSFFHKYLSSLQHYHQEYQSECVLTIIAPRQPPHSGRLRSITLPQ